MRKGLPRRVVAHIGRQFGRPQRASSIRRRRGADGCGRDFPSFSEKAIQNYCCPVVERFSWSLSGTIWPLAGRDKGRVHFVLKNTFEVHWENQLNPPDKWWSALQLFPSSCSDTAFGWNAPNWTGIDWTKGFEHSNEH